MSRRPAYPLSALVGQEDLVEALLVCAVNPAVGGVLVRGERGTAKSTAVRALAPMLATGAADGAVPLVELPLGATLDRLVGTLDLRAALEGHHRVESGLLGRADGGVLYVDEVNLLPDHLVDALLDAAASGEVTVERDGVSVVQDARFLLVGTMNPEEGELRPQLLDRFGLGVEVAGPRDAATRARIVARRLEFDADPAAFARDWQASETALAERIAGARARVAAVRVPERELLRISAVCSQLDLDGIRGDLVCAHAARALAALDGETEVARSHVERAAQLALRHRLRRDPLAPPPSGGRDPAIDDALEEASAQDDGHAGETGATPEREPSRAGRPDGDADPSRAERGRPEDDAAERDEPRVDRTPAGDSPPPPEPAWTPSPDLVAPPRPAPDAGDYPASRPAPVPRALPARLPEAALRLQRSSSARERRDAARPAPSGRAPGGNLATLDARPAEGDDPIAVLPTIIASLRGDRRPQTPIAGGGRGALLCLIVDTSGSMAARRRLARVKGAVEVALRRAYARRDLVAVVGFGGEGARTLVAPGAPLEQAAAAARGLPAGGRTPLAAGIAHAAGLLEAVPGGRLAGRARIAVLLTDGRATDPEGHARVALRRVVRAADRTVVVDLEEGPVRLGLAAELAAAAGADLTRLVASEPDHRPDSRSAA
jgi:magnesium chelatase subunit D